MCENEKKFREAIAQAMIRNPEKAADLEIAREYFLNPEFKKFLEETTFNINNKK